MVLIRCLLYFNLIFGALNIVLFIETIYQIQIERNCTQLQEKASLSYYKHNTNGQVISINACPYIAAILVSEETEDFDYDFICETVIVALFHSITTCSCVTLVEDYDKTAVKVRSGPVSWQKSGTLHDVVRIVKNEDFNRHYFDNDIAIIFVKPGFLQSEVIAVAGIKYNLRDESFINVIGWGVADLEKSAYKDTAFTSKLCRVTVQKINANVCEAAINGYLKTHDPDVPYQNKLDNTQFCAGPAKDGKDACVYDFGGPAVQNNVLVGIVSVGSAVCGPKEHPGIYTNLGKLHRWLLKMTKALNMQIKFVES